MRGCGNCDGESRAGDRQGLPGPLSCVGLQSTFTAHCLTEFNRPETWFANFSMCYVYLVIAGHGPFSIVTAASLHCIHPFKVPTNCHFASVFTTRYSTLSCQTRWIRWSGRASSLRSWAKASTCLRGGSYGALQNAGPDRRPHPNPLRAGRLQRFLQHILFAVLYGISGFTVGVGAVMKIYLLLEIHVYALMFILVLTLHSRGYAHVGKYVRFDS